MYQLTSGGSAVTAKTDLASGTLKGKQRNVFGSYLTYNDGLAAVQFDKLTSAGLTATYTVAVEAAVQYLGSHEYYWWGYGNKFLAKLSDGVSFKFLRVSSDFDTVAAITPASQTDAQKIEQKLTNLFQVPYNTVIPPVFV